MNECLNAIPGLSKVVSSRQYREALLLPLEVEEQYSNFAHGEYNQNFIFEHPTTHKKLLLRVERGSQMGIENQPRDCKEINVTFVSSLKKQLVKLPILRQFRL